MQRMGQRAGRGLGTAVLAVALAAAAVGCTDPNKLKGLCQADSDCPAKLSCVQGRCICQTDLACAENELCNAAGFCQAKVGCETSLDCPSGQFCDLTTGNCLDRTRCTVDVQCPLGQVCDQIRFQCVAGCRDVGDCNLGAVCQCPDGQPKCAADDPACPTGSEKCDGIGACQMGPCADNSYCKYGESCVSDGPGAPSRCVKDTRGPFCDPCTIAPGQNYCSGDGANFCLVDTSKQYGSYFCGVQCQQDADCPWGFGCDDVLILTQSTCGTGGQGECQSRDDMPCQTDADCPGGECDLTAHLCRSICVGNEGDVQGFCTCLKDTDCPTDSCGTDGRCLISRQQCDANTPCSQIFCKDSEDPQTHKAVGYCFIGRNCAPVDGVSCDQVRSATP